MPSNKRLVVRKSKLPGAGHGLFTNVAFQRGERIVEYKGRIQPWNEVKDQDGHNGYLLRLDRSTAINALLYRKSPGRYANDAAGFARVKGLHNNAEYLIYGNRCFICATRSIAPGQEILVGYGKEFWALKKRIQEATHKGTRVPTGR